MRFPGWLALVPALGAVTSILAGPAALVNNHVLSRPVLVRIRLLSYPLYVWHWPPISFAYVVRQGKPPTPLLARYASGARFCLPRSPIVSWRSLSAFVLAIVLLRRRQSYSARSSVRHGGVGECGTPSALPAAAGHRPQQNSRRSLGCRLQSYTGHECHRLRSLLAGPSGPPAGTKGGLKRR